MSAAYAREERRNPNLSPRGDDEFGFTRQKSHHSYDKHRLQYLKRLARPVVGTLLVAAFATGVFKSPPQRVEAPTVAPAGAAAVELRQSDRQETQLDPLLLRLEPGSDQHG
jgi:hypothetical protein